MPSHGLLHELPNTSAHSHHQLPGHQVVKARHACRHRAAEPPASRLKCKGFKQRQRQLRRTSEVGLHKAVLASSQHPNGTSTAGITGVCL